MRIKLNKKLILEGGTGMNVFPETNDDLARQLQSIPTQDQGGPNTLQNGWSNDPGLRASAPIDQQPYQNAASEVQGAPTGPVNEFMQGD